MPLLVGGLAAAVFVARERTTAEPRAPASALPWDHPGDVERGSHAALFCVLQTDPPVYSLLAAGAASVVIKTGVAYLPFGVVISLQIGLASAAGFEGRRQVDDGDSATALSAVGMLLVMGITVHCSDVTQVLSGMLVTALGIRYHLRHLGHRLRVVGRQAGTPAWSSASSSTAGQVGGAVGLALLTIHRPVLRHPSSLRTHMSKASCRSTNGAILGLQGRRSHSRCRGDLPALARPHRHRLVGRKRRRRRPSRATGRRLIDNQAPAVNVPRATSAPDRDRQDASSRHHRRDRLSVRITSGPAGAPAQHFQTLGRQGIRPQTSNDERRMPPYRSAIVFSSAAATMLPT